MSEIWMLILKISIVLFMAGNLLNMGLRLNPRDALRGLRDIRFVVHTIVWGFAAIPALAYLVTRIMPLNAGHSAGLLLLGMAPCAPFLPMLVGRLKGDQGYTAAFMLLASLGTVLFMPFAIPVLVKGLSVSAWVIAKPLVFFILVPLALGMLLFQTTPGTAAVVQPWVKRITGLSTIAVVILCFVVYGKDMISAIGSFAVVSQLVFFVLVASLTFLFGIGLKYDQKMILSTGMTTRNVGAALAPLLSATQMNHEVTVMVVLGLPVMILASMLLTLIFKRRVKTQA